MWWDKVDSKFAGWDEARFRAAGFRAVPGAIVRRTAFIAKGVVLMPSFVNVGAYVDEGTMVDTWATVGSCAQIGKHCHISGGAGHRRRAGADAGRAHHHRGQLLHRRARRSGRRRDRGRRQRAVDGRLSRPRPRSSTARRGEVLYGRVPPYSVVVSGTLPAANGKPVALLRRDRQARRREDPRQDLDQRTAARLGRHFLVEPSAPATVATMISTKPTPTSVSAIDMREHAGDGR